MRLGDLYDAMVRAADGRKVGAVHEVYVENGEVTALGVGAANYLERLFGRRRGRRIPWSSVRSIDAGVLVVDV